MIAGNPVTVSSTAPVTVPIPTAGGSGTVQGVKLSNTSNLFVIVSIGGSSIFLDPQSYLTIPLGGMSSIITLALAPNQLLLPATIYPTFFYTGDPHITFSQSPTQQSIGLSNTTTITPATSGELYVGNISQDTNITSSSGIYKWIQIYADTTMVYLYYIGDTATQQPVVAIVPNSQGYGTTPPGFDYYFRQGFYIANIIGSATDLTVFAYISYGLIPYSG
jgi:hypothetical protein